jgi:hypothetical protein
VATIKADQKGRNWLLIGSIQPPRTFGPEFGYEERCTPPAAERFYSAAESYADTVHAGGTFSRLIGRIFAANAERLHADLTGRGCRLRVEDGTLWVMHPHLLSEEDIAQVEILKPHLVRLVLERVDCSVLTALAVDGCEFART